MKMIKCLAALAAVLFLAVGCTKENTFFEPKAVDVDKKISLDKYVVFIIIHMMLSMVYCTITPRLAAFLVVYKRE